MKLSRLGLACVAAGLAILAACTPPKYVNYWSIWRDWRASVPWGWNIMTDQEDTRYASTSLIGPYAPEFYLGVPSISVKWYEYKTAHRLPDGLAEYYKDADDYIGQTLKAVYGPKCAQFWDAKNPPRDLPEIDQEDLDKPCTLVALKDAKAEPNANKPGALRVVGHPDLVYLGDGKKAKHFIVLAPTVVPSSVRNGVLLDPKSGRKYVVRMHEYVVVPLEKGFYVLVYPATRPGYYLFAPHFSEFVNTFKIAKEGPETAPSAAPVANAVPGAKPKPKK